MIIITIVVKNNGYHIFLICYFGLLRLIATNVCVLQRTVVIFWRLKYPMNKLNHTYQTSKNQHFQLSKTNSFQKDKTSTIRPATTNIHNPATTYVCNLPTTNICDPVTTYTCNPAKTNHFSPARTNTCKSARTNTCNSTRINNCGPGRSCHHFTKKSEEKAKWTIAYYTSHFFNRSSYSVTNNWQWRVADRWTYWYCSSYACKALPIYWMPSSCMGIYFRGLSICRHSQRRLCPNNEHRW